MAGNGFWCPMTKVECVRSDCVGATCEEQRTAAYRLFRQGLREEAHVAAAALSPDPGREHWVGIFKVMEEAGELGAVLAEMQGSLSRLTTVLGKLAVRPLGNHWDTYYAGDIVERLEHELGDVIAACEWFVKNNDRLSPLNVAARVEYKKRRFDSWRLSGVREEGGEQTAGKQTADSRQPGGESRQQTADSSEKKDGDA